MARYSLTQGQAPKLGNYNRRYVPSDVLSFIDRDCFTERRRFKYLNTEADLGRIYRELPMVRDKEFSLRMICDNFCIMDDRCRADRDVVRASIGEHAERNKTFERGKDKQSK